MAGREKFDPDALADFEELGDLLADRSRSSNERTRLGGASALIAAIGLVAFPGESPAIGVVGALVVLAAWYLLTPTYAFALGHVALAGVLPEGAFAQGTHLVWLAAVEAGLLGILLASVAEYSPAEFGDSGTSEGRERTEIDDDSEGLADSTSRAAVGAGLVLGWVVVGGGLAWASARSSLGLPAAGSLLVVSAGIVAYGLHRYQLVSLGLVSDGDEREYDEEGDDGEGDDEKRGDEERDDEERDDKKSDVEERDDEERDDEAVGDDDE